MALIYLKEKGKRGGGGVALPQGMWRGLSLPFWLLCSFFVLCTFGGGSSRAPTLSLVYLRPAAVLCIAATVLFGRRLDFTRYRVPLLVLVALAATIAIQLVPLPPQWVASLPGHDKFAEVTRLTGGQAPWQTISLAPDLTLNSLLALLPSLVVMVAFAAMNEADRDRSLIIIPALALATILFAVLQLAQGPDSSAYLYAITSRTLPVGLFANRNHQATALALAIPAFASLAVVLARRYGSGAAVFGICCVASLLCVLFNLITGSRSGLALLVVGVLGSGAILWPFIANARHRSLMVAGIGVALLAAICLAVVSGRATVVERLTSDNDPTGDMRVRTIPVLMQLIRDYFPFGSGFGTFDPVFRSIEPDYLLRQAFFNNAHNDFIELAITGGFPALLVLAMALLWFFWRGWHITHSARSTSIQIVLARLAWLGLLIISLASLSDYPVRTPIFAAVAALMAAWLCPPVEHRDVASD